MSKRGRLITGPVKKMTAFDVIAAKAKIMGFGELPLKLIIHDGRVTGFNQTDPALIKFRE